MKKNLYKLYIYVSNTCVAERRIWAEDDTDAIDKAIRQINRWWRWRYGDTPLKGKNIRAVLWEEYPTHEPIWSWRPEEEIRR